MHRYPDISDILARKAEGRRMRARLSFGEKLKLLEARFGIYVENLGSVARLRRALDARDTAFACGKWTFAAFIKIRRAQWFTRDSV
jgi:hypothetical protein